METFVIVLISIFVIILIHHKVYFESFISEPNYKKTNPTSILVFVSKSCGHCVNYNTKHHEKLVELAKNKGINVKRIFSDEDPENLFSKYNIMYVPAVYIMEGDKIHKNLGSNVNPENIMSEIEKSK